MNIEVMENKKTGDKPAYICVEVWDNDDKKYCDWLTKVHR